MFFLHLCRTNRSEEYKFDFWWGIFFSTLLTFKSNSWLIDFKIHQKSGVWIDHEFKIRFQTHDLEIWFWTHFWRINFYVFFRSQIFAQRKWHLWESNPWYWEKHNDGRGFQVSLLKKNQHEFKIMTLSKKIKLMYTKINNMMNEINRNIILLIEILIKF